MFPRQTQRRLLIEGVVGQLTVESDNDLAEGAKKKQRLSEEDATGSHDPSPRRSQQQSQQQQKQQPKSEKQPPKKGNRSRASADELQQLVIQVSRLCIRKEDMLNSLRMDTGMILHMSTGADGRATPYSASNSFQPTASHLVPLAFGGAGVTDQQARCAPSLRPDVAAGSQYRACEQGLCISVQGLESGTTTPDPNGSDTSLHSRCAVPKWRFKCLGSKRVFFRQAQSTRTAKFDPQTLSRKCSRKLAQAQATSARG